MDGMLLPDFHDHPVGARIAEHAHPDGQVLLAVAGRMTVHVADRRVDIDPRTALWVPPHVPHASVSVTATAFRGVMVDAVTAAMLPAHPRVFVASPLLNAAAPELTAARARRRELASSLLVDELQARLTPAAPPQGSLRFAELCARVTDDPASAPDLDDAARLTGQSRRNFSRTFRGATGRSWAAWVREIRLSRAAELIAGGAHVTDAALSVGYATPSALSVAFRRERGHAPGRLRRPR
jgi:AraC-like DNA-binding protein